MSANWLVYVWAVNAGRVLETSLGYFMNPLVTVLLGVVVLGERLRPVQWAALGGAAGAVLLQVATLTPLNLEPTVQIVSPHVFPAFRRRGVGRALMDSAVGFAEELGVDHVASGSSSASAASGASGIVTGIPANVVTAA